MQLLDDYLTIPQLADQLKRSVRWVQSAIQRQQIPVTNYGRTRLIHVPSFRKILLARETKVASRRERK